MKILITAPSLNEDENVSGIASLVRSIIALGKNEYLHFAAGRKDAEGFGIAWYLRQLMLPVLYRRTIKNAAPDVVHINTSFEPRSIVRDSVLAAATPKGTPIVLHVHGGRFVLQNYPSQVIASRANQMLRVAAKVIVLSEAEKTSLLTRVPGINIDVMPNAVDTGEIPFAQRTASTKSILYFGRMDIPKGLPDIINACRKLAEVDCDFKFISCGTGPDERWFVKEMRDALGERFEHRGVVKGAEKLNVLSSADIFLLPSTFEGLPIALLEAMAAGCTPVVTNVGAMAEAVDDGSNGYVIGPHDVESIVDRLQQLLSSPESQLTAMRTRARNTIEERYDVKPYVERLEELYCEVIRK
jgi:glycosyltransferase involved in cell wall biosynthesis